MTDTKRPIRVFLCHSSDDKSVVKELYNHLVKDGIDAWLDKENLFPGQDWKIEIPKAVRNSDVVIVCLSSHSITKEGYVQKEIKLALDVADEKPEGTIFIIPARLEDCEIPERINRFHWVDLFSTDGYGRLLKALQVRADSVGASIAPQKNKKEKVVQNTSASTEMRKDKDEVEKSKNQDNPQLPPRQYRDFVGRQFQLDDIENALNDTLGKWIIAIDGIGGIGKTALAREITERMLANKSFEKIVWEQSPKDIVITNPSRGLTYDGVLDAIAYQLDAFELLQVVGKEKEERVKNLLHTHKTLVVLDNLETAHDTQNSIIERLSKILSFSKAVLTSRHRFSGEVYPVHLTGLIQDDAIDLIRREGKNKNVTQIEKAEIDDLRKLVLAASASPLALKLVVGQLGHLPLDVVLEQLSLIHIPQDGAEEDDYTSFYKGIFMPSWKLLSNNSQNLLVTMAIFPAGIGGTFDAIREISDISSATLTHSIDELWKLSFLEVEQTSSLKNTRYYLHALTQNFVLSDIVKA